MRAAVFLALKDLRLLLRDRAAAFFTFVFPLAIALFFGYVLSGTTSEPLRVAAFVEQSSPAATMLIQALDEDDGFKLTVTDARATGEQLVRRGDAVALVIVPAAYAEGIDGVFSGGGAKLGLVVDPSRRAEGAMLVGKIHEVAFRTVFATVGDPVQFARVLDRMEESLKASDFSFTDRLAIRTALSRARTMSAPAADGSAAKQPQSLGDWKPVTVEIAELSMRPGVPANSFAISFMQGIAWALFGAVLSFGSGIAEERQRGTLDLQFRVRAPEIPSSHAQSIRHRAQFAAAPIQ